MFEEKLITAILELHTHVFQLGDQIIKKCRIFRLVEWLHLFRFSCSQNRFNFSSSYLQVYLWGGLLLFCGFIVWDTQMIIEKRKRGDRDFIKHSLDLFIDFMQVFRRVVVLLMQKVMYTFTSQPCFYEMSRGFCFTVHK